MTGQAELPKAQIKIEGLVRDTDGNPKIDGDPNDLPLSVKQALTEEERNRLGVRLP